MALPRQRQDLELLSLPDALVVKCLSFLTLKERLKTVCFTSKRLRELCLAPELLRSLQLAETGPQAAERAASLALFLTSHGTVRHVRSLTLHACAASPLWGVPEEEAQDALVDLNICGALEPILAALAAGSCLHELVLSAATPLASERSWLCGLSQLRVLWMGRVQDSLQLPRSCLSRLSCLKELGLRGRSIRLHAGDAFPSTLTKLCIDGPAGSTLLPQQLPRLTRLQVLEVSHCILTPSTLAPLSALTTLRALQLEDLEALPAGLVPALPQLRRVALSGPAPVPAAEVDAALAPLQQQLERLVLGISLLDRLPPLVPQLRLERLLLHTDLDDVDEGLPADAPLLASLRWLGLTWGLACASLAALAAAPRLEYLCLTEAPRPPEGDADDPAWQGFWGWAAVHPPLRRLGLEVGDTYYEQPQLSVALIDALLELAARRPGLAIRRTPAPPGDLGWCRSGSRDPEEFFFFWEEMFG